jgi:hypothetical protein
LSSGKVLAVDISSSPAADHCLARIDACGFHRDEHLAISGNGLRDRTDYENIDIAVRSN